MNTLEQPRRPFPPFDAESATQKVRMAEDAWNTRDPKRVSLAYSANSQQRNRSEFLTGLEAIVQFLTRKWSHELDYRLIKELWAYHDHRIAVRFAYEWHDSAGNWFRSYGNENWEFDDNGLMRRRLASINDLSISENNRKFLWPLGRRPDGHPGLSELGLQQAASAHALLDPGNPHNIDLMRALRESIVSSKRGRAMGLVFLSHPNGIALPSTFAPEVWLDGLPLRVSSKDTDTRLAKLATASSLKNKMGMADRLYGTLTTVERIC